MKIWVTIALSFGLLAVGIAQTAPPVSGSVPDGEAWKKTLTPIQAPGAFPASYPEGEALYDFGWAGVKAATGTLTYSEERKGKERFGRIDFTSKTVGFLRQIWRLDAKAFSIVQWSTFLPTQMRLLEVYRSKIFITVLEFYEDYVLYSKGEVKRAPGEAFMLDTPLTREEMGALTGAKVKKFKFHPVLDMQSAMLFVRSQGLKRGETIRLVIFHQNAAYLAELKVLGREKVTVRAGTFPAIKLDMKLQWIDKEHRLQTHKKFKKAVGWFSDDSQRLLLKIESEVFVGSVWGELVRFTPSQKKAIQAKDRGVAPIPLSRKIRFTSPR